jgi:threonine dehydrogenase-like Zn-dependent dehydrogenase
MSKERHIAFKAQEYTIDDDFSEADYEFIGDVDSGWQIKRNNQDHLKLGAGYELIKTKLCGICSTDINRRFLPFPLPQITGHEIVATSLDDEEQKFVVEINDTSYYRGDSPLDTFSQSGLYTHSPGKKVIGIDRLPGGFGPYILAPKNSIIPIGDLNEYAAVLIEPFAAALQAVMASPPEEGDTVAVLGPRKLGALLIAALAAYRRFSGRQFEITALARRKNILGLCEQLGADRGIDTSQVSVPPATFDIVYDTTGTAAGFELALTLADREVHLKSTNGQKTCGLDTLTAFVVDELALLAFNDTNLEFTWPGENRTNKTAFLSPGVELTSVPGKTCFQASAGQAGQFLDSDEFDGTLRRFDIAVASSLDEIDQIIRPGTKDEDSILRPRGAILFVGDPGNNPLLNFISRGGKLRSSRCGEFDVALEFLKANRDIADTMAQFMISHKFPSEELVDAFEIAQRSSSLKVVIEHSQQQGGH